MSTCIHVVGMEETVGGSRWSGWAPEEKARLQGQQRRKRMQRTKGEGRGTGRATGRTSKRQDEQGKGRMERREKGEGRREKGGRRSGARLSPL